MQGKLAARAVFSWPRRRVVLARDEGEVDIFLGGGGGCGVDVAPRCPCDVAI